MGLRRDCGNVIRAREAAAFVLIDVVVVVVVVIVVVVVVVVVVIAANVTFGAAIGCIHCENVVMS